MEEQCTYKEAPFAFTCASQDKQIIINVILILPGSIVIVYYRPIFYMLFAMIGLTKYLVERCYRQTLPNFHATLTIVAHYTRTLIQKQSFYSPISQGAQNMNSGLIGHKPNVMSLT